MVIVAKSKRGPGGGRKPIGQFPKSAAFTTRLEPATRRALDEAARAKGKSVSVMAELLLKAALKKPHGSPRNQALAAMVAELAETAERDTGKSWRDDAWSAEALRYYVDATVAHFAAKPADKPTPPAAIEKAAATMPAELAELYRTPRGYGLVKAQLAIAEIEQAAMPSHDEWSLPIFFNERPARLGIIGRDLGITKDRKGKAR
jgi:hypothetical protein